MPDYTDSISGTYWIWSDRLGPLARIHNGACKRVTTGLQVTAYPSHPRTPRAFRWVGPYDEFNEAVVAASKLSTGKEVEGCVECGADEDLRRMHKREEDALIKTAPMQGFKTFVFAVLFLLVIVAFWLYADPAIRHRIFPDREWEAKVECAQRWSPECERFR